MVRKLVTMVIPILVVSIIILFYYEIWGNVFPLSYKDSVIISLGIFFVSLIIDIYIFDKIKLRLTILTYRRIWKYTLIIGLMFLLGGNISTVLMFLIDFHKNFVAHIIICYILGLLISKLILYGVYRLITPR